MSPRPERGERLRQARKPPRCSLSASRCLKVRNKEEKTDEVCGAILLR